jgi:hypothetical protein
MNSSTDLFSFRGSSAVSSLLGSLSSRSTLDAARRVYSQPIFRQNLRAASASLQIQAVKPSIVLPKLLAQLPARLSRPPKPRDEASPDDADRDGGGAMKCNIDDGYVELSRVVPVTQFKPSRPIHHNKKKTEMCAREQTREVVRQEDEPAGRRVLRLGHDVVKARHREEEAEHCQDSWRLVEQRVGRRRGHGAKAANSKGG